MFLKFVVYYVIIYTIQNDGRPLQSTHRSMYTIHCIPTVCSTIIIFQQHISDILYNIQYTYQNRKTYFMEYFIEQRIEMQMTFPLPRSNQTNVLSLSLNYKSKVCCLPPPERSGGRELVLTITRWTYHIQIKKPKKKRKRKKERRRCVLLAIRHKGVE